MRTVNISEKEFYQLYNEFKNGIEKEMKNINSDLEKIMAKQIAEDVKRAYMQIINAWYSSFTPGIYNRKYTLRNAIQVSIESDNTVVITLSDDNLSGHRVGNEYLYNLTMRQGYHGGAMYNGVPMYRTQPPFLCPDNPWAYWSRPAEKTFSPVRALRSWVNSYNSPKVQVKVMQRVLKKYLSKYKFFRLFYM